MSNEATEQKSLGEINFDAAKFDRNWKWPTETKYYRDCFEAGAKAVEAAVLARQPKPVATGESLSDAVLEREWDATILEIGQGYEWRHQGACTRIHRLFAHKIQGISAVLAQSDTGLLTHEKVESLYDAALGSSTHNSFRDLPSSFQDVIKAFARSILASRTAAPTYYETAKRPPTEADFVEAKVFGWSVVGKSWWERSDANYLLSDTRDSHWFSVKFPPAPVPPVSAEDAAWKAHMEESEGNFNRDSWDAALAFAASQKPA